MKEERGKKFLSSFKILVLLKILFSFCY